MLRHRVELHDRGRVERCDGVQTNNRRRTGASANVDEDQVGGEGRTIDVELAGAGEAGLPADQVDALGAGDSALAAGAKARDDIAFPLTDLLHVDGDWTRQDAVVGAAPGEIGNAGASNHGLGRRTALVDAGAADMLALDERGAAAGARESCGEGAPGLPGADDDGVVVLKLIGHRCSTE